MNDLTPMKMQSGSMEEQNHKVGDVHTAISNLHLSISRINELANKLEERLDSVMRTSDDADKEAFEPFSCPLANEILDIDRDAGYAIFVLRQIIERLEV